MDCSDWISIISAVVSFLVTIIIAGLQIWQSGRMEKFEYRQDERDERRHAEEVKAKSVAFISKYYADRGLIPLCAIAAMHNDLFYYSREMYREFCCLTLEVQNRILEYCELDLRVVETKELFENCIMMLEKVLQEHFPDDESPFYDGGNYVLRSLEYYGGERIPVKNVAYLSANTNELLDNAFSVASAGRLPYESCITDVLCEAFQGKGSHHPISYLEKECGFKCTSEIEACQFATTLAQYVAIYGSENNNPDKDYGAPGGYAGETIDTMEDLFLLSVYEMYIHWILKDDAA